MGERAERVVVFHQKRAPVRLLAWRDGLAGQVEVGGQGDVGTRGVAEYPELRTEPGIEIQQVVLAIPGVQADIEIEQSAISKPREQGDDLVAELLVGHRAPQAGQPGGGRVGPILDAGEGRMTDRCGVAVAVEEPVRSLVARDELLQHQPGARSRAAFIAAVQFLRDGHDRGTAEPAAVGPRRGELGDQRVTSGRGEFTRLRERTGNDRLRAGHAKLTAEEI